MWDLIVSVPDHCLSFYFSNWGQYSRDRLTRPKQQPVVLFTSDDENEIR